MNKIYAVPGSNEQHIGKPLHAPSGAVEMNELRPTKNHIATVIGSWELDPAMVAQDIENADREIEKNTGQFANLTMAQAEAWIDINVSDLASAKNALKKIVRLILART